jgi:undecaprenyl pyrophosphate phosphatase UppP
MYDIAMLVFAAIAAIGAVIAVLPLFGVDLRIIGRPKMPIDQSASRPTRKAWVALIVAIVSAGHAS